MEWKKTPLSIALALSCLLLVACNDDDDGDDASSNGAAAWSYDGETGPAFWGDLDPSYALLKDGKSQSPINIATDDTADGSTLAPLALNYKATPISVENNGHAIEQVYAAGSSVTVGGKAYNLLQCHFHSLSEHTVDGNHFPLEMHCVHQAADGSLLVIGVLFNEGAENAALQPIWDNLPQSADQSIEQAEQSFNAASVIGTPGGFYHYQGSLTTPPGTEGVEWYILSNPRQASAAQLASFRALYDHNFRPTQPLNGRTVSRQ